MTAWWDGDFGDDDTRPPIFNDEAFYALVFILACLTFAVVLAVTI